MKVAAVRAPAHDHARLHSVKVVSDPPPDLVLVARWHAGVGIVPQLDGGEAQYTRRPTQFLAANLRQLLRPPTGRPPAPAGAAPCEAQQVDFDPSTDVACDRAASPH